MKRSFKSLVQIGDFFRFFRYVVAWKQTGVRSWLQISLQQCLQSGGFHDSYSLRNIIYVAISYVYQGKFDAWFWPNMNRKKLFLLSSSQHTMNPRDSNKREKLKIFFCFRHISHWIILITQVNLLLLYQKRDKRNITGTGSLQASKTINLMKEMW